MSELVGIALPAAIRRLLIHAACKLMHAYARLTSWCGCTLKLEGAKRTHVLTDVADEDHCITRDLRLMNCKLRITSPPVLLQRRFAMKPWQTRCLLHVLRLCLQKQATNMPRFQLLQNEVEEQSLFGQPGMFLKQQRAAQVV